MEPSTVKYIESQYKQVVIEKLKEKHLLTPDITSIIEEIGLKTNDFLDIEVDSRSVHTDTPQKLTEMNLICDYQFFNTNLNMYEQLCVIHEKLLFPPLMTFFRYFKEKNIIVFNLEQIYNTSFKVVSSSELHIYKEEQDKLLFEYKKTNPDVICCIELPQSAEEDIHFPYKFSLVHQLLQIKLNKEDVNISLYIDRTSKYIFASEMINSNSYIMQLSKIARYNKVEKIFRSAHINKFKSFNVLAAQYHINMPKDERMFPENKKEISFFLDIVKQVQPLKAMYRSDLDTVLLSACFIYNSLPRFEDISPYNYVQTNSFVNKHKFLFVTDIIRNRKNGQVIGHFLGMNGSTIEVAVYQKSKSSIAFSKKQEKFACCNIGHFEVDEDCRYTGFIDI